MESLSVQKKVYLKAYLHACKYAAEDCVGVLVGSKNVLVDAFPLFHSRVNQCSLEIAFDLIQAQLAPDQSIVGIYEAQVQPKSGISELGKEILDSLKQKIYMKIVEIENDDEKSQLISKVGGDKPYPVVLPPQRRGPRQARAGQRLRVRHPRHRPQDRPAPQDHRLRRPLRERGPRLHQQLSELI